MYVRAGLDAQAIANDLSEGFNALAHIASGTMDPTDIAELRVTVGKLIAACNLLDTDASTTDFSDVSGSRELARGIVLALGEGHADTTQLEEDASRVLEMMGIWSSI